MKSEPVLTEVQTSRPESGSSKREASAPAAPVACIELDRFCAACAYNLRTLPVYRDERTGIPIVRCPECGRYQSANDTATALRPWAHRLTSLIIGVWVLTIITSFIWLGVAEGAMSYATLDELTHRAGTQIQRIGTMTIRTGRGTGPLQVWNDMPDFALFMSVMLIGSVAIAFTSGLLAAVLCPHWRRGAGVALMVAMPLAAGGVIALTWHYEAPHLFGWGMSYIFAHAGAQLSGGLLGIVFGRPVARVIVRIFLPPSMRPRLAYLWLTDGRPLPQCAAPFVTGDG